MKHCEKALTVIGQLASGIAAAETGMVQCELRHLSSVSAVDDLHFDDQHRARLVAVC